MRKRAITARARRATAGRSGMRQRPTHTIGRIVRSRRRIRTSRRARSSSRTRRRRGRSKVVAGTVSDRVSVRPPRTRRRAAFTAVGHARRSRRGDGSADAPLALNGPCASRSAALCFKERRCLHATMFPGDRGRMPAAAVGHVAARARGDAAKPRDPASRTNSSWSRSSAASWRSVSRYSTACSAAPWASWIATRSCFNPAPASSPHLCRRLTRRRARSTRLRVRISRGHGLRYRPCPAPMKNSARRSRRSRNG